MSIVKALVNGKVVNWNSHVISKENEIRVFTSPGLRVDQVRKFYWTVRRMYSDLSEEAVDAAFEAYVLGWILAPEVLTFARRYTECLDEGFRPSVPSLGFHEATGDIFDKKSF